MGATPIQWTDWSVNPIRCEGPEGQLGHYCEKISLGCKNCYASRLQARFRMPQFQEQRARSLSLRMDKKKLEAVLRRRKPTKIFWCDMTDIFGEWVPDEWIATCFGVMAATPQHTHQVLTKRAKRMREWFEWCAHAAQPAHINTGTFCIDQAQRLGAVGSHNGFAVTWPLPNVWIGVSAEDQQRADARIPHLLATPAAVRFVSAEPLLEAVDLVRFLKWKHPVTWVICGGESGSNARTFDLAWARDLRDQCKAAGVPFFFKQAGGRPYDSNVNCSDYETLPCIVPPPGVTGAAAVGLKFDDRKGGDLAELPYDLRVREFPRCPA